MSLFFTRSLHHMRSLHISSHFPVDIILPEIVSQNFSQMTVNSVIFHLTTYFIFISQSCDSRNQRALLFTPVKCSTTFIVQSSYFLRNVDNIVKKSGLKSPPKPKYEIKAGNLHLQTEVYIYSTYFLSPLQSEI